MDPKMGFIIMRDDDLADTRRRSLDLLYQPLLRPIGYALINILWRLSEINSNSLAQRPFKDLLTYLNVDLPTFKRSLLRVEGAGLLKVFYEHNSDYNFYIFHLIQPESPREFFNDDLLSVALLELIGNQRFVKLSQALIPKPLNIKDVHNVTHNFLEIYTVNHKHITTLPDLIKQVRAGIRAKMKSSLKSDHQLIDESPDFNFKLFMSLIKHDSFANPKDVYSHRHLILSEHVLYGLDERAMASYIGSAASVVNNKVDFNKFRLLIAKAFQGNSRKPVKAKYKVKSVPSNRSRKASSQTDRHNEQLLINAAEYYSPMQFLFHLKKQLNPNAIVTYQEENILKQALEYGAFRDNRGVINILVYYSLAERKMPTLKPKFLQYMITAWNQSNVNTPAEALAEIKAHQEKRAKRWLHYRKRGQNKFSYRKRPRIKQKLPKWARSDYHVKLHPTSKKLQRKIKKQLNNLNHQPNHRKGGNK